LLRDSSAMIVYLDGKHLRRTNGSGNRNSKQPDRSTSSDGNCFGGDLASEYGVNSVAERIKNRRVLLRNGGVEFPDVLFRDDYVFSERAVRVYADDFDVLADMRFTCSALQTFTAGNVHLRGNEIAFFYAGDFVAVGHNLSAKFVPWDQRRMNAVLRPAVP